MIESLIYGASVAFAMYWFIGWLNYRQLSIGHSASFICAGMLMGVVAFFRLHPDISRYHMLWAMPAAFFGSTFVSRPYTRWLLRRRHPEMF
jgi:hypothetical protein